MSDKTTYDFKGERYDENFVSNQSPLETIAIGGMNDVGSKLRSEWYTGDGLAYTGTYMPKNSIIYSAVVGLVIFGVVIVAYLIFLPL